MVYVSCCAAVAGDDLLLGDGSAQGERHVSKGSAAGARGEGQGQRRSALRDPGGGLGLHELGPGVEGFAAACACCTQGRNSWGKTRT